MASTSTATISGFTVLPVDYGDDVTHYLYLRAHAGTKKNPAKNQILPDGRTLFLVNVPPDATERELVLFFKTAGTVERVVFDGDAEVEQEEDAESDSEEEPEDAVLPDVDADEAEQPARKRRKLADKPAKPTVIPLPSTPLRRLRGTGRTAHVIFLDQSSLARALTLPTKPRTWPASDEPSGLAHYLARYDAARPPLDAVRAHADSAMELFEYELAQTRQKSKYRKGEAIVDEDGFTLVTRGGARRGETTTRPVKKGKKEKANFYAFQKAEKQRNDLLELKKNWEADKAKIEKLKAARKFKPY
ncbi:hypothetical protein MKEN_00254600 [Mycena kentingensis (nom. inval.)]|nr:hypothetical protein MKEN_00254600 [Mycena kentingensis (nom. inval.)]